MEKVKKTEMVTFRVDAQTYEFLRRLAVQKDWTVSHLCCRIMMGAVKDAAYLRDHDLA